MVATATETEHLNQTGLSLVFNPSQKLGQTLYEYSNSGKYDLHNPELGTAGALNSIIDKPGAKTDPNYKPPDYLLASVEGGEADVAGNTVINTDSSLLGDRGMPEAASKILQGENKYKPGKIGCLKT